MERVSGTHGRFHLANAAREDCRRVMQAPQLSWRRTAVQAGRRRADRSDLALAHHGVLGMTERPLPLDGLRVLDFRHSVMGPRAGFVLADLGAGAIRLAQASGDPT